MTVLAPAKVNLTLEVLGRRHDGYHALRSVVMPVSLADGLEIEEADGFTTDTGYPDDLILKAARALDPTRGVRVHVTKRIPAGGGLGGGSADAAATLLALNAMRRYGHTPAALAEIGARVGSDVPALVLAQATGEPVRMEGRGETVAPLLSEPVRTLHLVLANPGVACPTPAVFARCTARADVLPSPTDAMAAALAAGDLDRIGAALANDLERPAVSLHPEIGRLLATLREEGAASVAMSGSGSSVFALVVSGAAAADLAGRLRAKGVAAVACTTGGAASAGDCGSDDCMCMRFLHPDVSPVCSNGHASTVGRHT